RTYVPLAAGMADYRYRKFLVWNVTGAALWTLSVTGLGVLLGRIPFVRDHVDLLAIIVVIVSVVPIVLTAVVRVRRGRRAARDEVDRAVHVE
ncbi:MAG TPA: DedA family protein, partial [Marmoricola sp.]|nr:DedA family protein [Marmoricola sp.]